MNSTQKNQSNEKMAHLEGNEAIKKIRELADEIGSCFFRTDVSLHDSHTAIPMSVQKTDANGDIWFLSAIDSLKNKELTEKPSATLFFQGSEYSEFLEIHGTLRISQDKERINELWSPVINNWFTEGKDDPRITVLQFSPQSGYYWDSRHGNTIAGIKVLIGAVTGTSTDDSVEGRIDL